MAQIYNPWQNTEESPLAGQFLTPVLLNGADSEDMAESEADEQPEMEEESPHGDMMKQALDTILQQSTLIGQLTAKLAGK